MESLQTNPPNHSERVKAWIYAVINPWTEACEFENAFLTRRCASFRWRKNRLEHIRDVKSHLLSGAALILEDLERFNHDARFLRVEHDAFVPKILGASNALMDLLRVAPDVDASIRACTDMNPEAARAISTDPAVVKSTLLEDVVNNEQELSDQYSDSALWNKCREELLRFRTGAAADGLDASLAELERFNNKSIDALRKLRWALVDKYDVPPARID